VNHVPCKVLRTPLTGLRNTRVTASASSGRASYSDLIVFHVMFESWKLPRFLPWFGSECEAYPLPSSRLGFPLPYTAFSSAASERRCSNPPCDRGSSYFVTVCHGYVLEYFSIMWRTFVQSHPRS
jgi:hypothetical protein